MSYQFHPPYLGAAYYPEVWDESEFEKDIEKMHTLGITAVRIGEFSWSKMEPRPEEYHFDWLHRIVDRLGKEDIAVVLCTPSATPPVWLAEMYPDAMMETIGGRVRVHGGRRHFCSNNPKYIEYSLRIAEHLVAEFADDPAVVAWQIDNEIYMGDDGCFCEYCKNEFHEFLRRKFGTIEELNRAWNLSLWSQEYSSFAQIPLPRDAWHNPHLGQEWRIFQNQSHIAFVHKQAEILHRYTKMPVGTDTMPFFRMEYRDMESQLDVAMFNHYNVPSNEHWPALWFDYLRNLSKHPFWNTETATVWTSSTVVGTHLLPSGFCRMNSWLPVAMGGEANMYWLWRTHSAGHELTHSAVLDTCGKPMHIWPEIQRTAEEFRKAADFLCDTKVVSDLALHFTSLSWNMLETQQLVAGLTYKDIIYNRFYRQITLKGLRPDILDSGASLDGYKLLISPLMLSLDNRGLDKRIIEWVRNGGVWVAGPLTDIRNQYGAKWKDRHYGILEELTGAQFAYSIPEVDGMVSAAWCEDGTPCNFGCWTDLVDAPDENILARVTAGPDVLVGKALHTIWPVGKGWVILIGAFPPDSDLRRLLSYAYEKAGIHTRPAEGNLMVIPRSGNGKEGLILLEYTGSPAAYEIKDRMTDLLTGKVYEAGRIELQPFDVMVLCK